MMMLTRHQLMNPLLQELADVQQDDGGDFSVNEWLELNDEENRRGGHWRYNRL